tara:strand:+ start:5720 stop:6058 length:339 start_codon:yes stop_codon:yes gene_type:complete
MLKKFYSWFPIVQQLQVITLFTLFDLICTVYWVDSGNATEANPLLNYVLGFGMIQFAFVKLALGLGSIWILYKNLDHWLVRSSVPLILFSYGWLTLHHCKGFYLWLINLLAS